MIEGKNPLICDHVRSQWQYKVTKAVKIKLLRLTWNAFARLLDINWPAVFICPICGPLPSVVICDGTMLGFCKDLLEAFQEQPPLNNPVVSGSCHADR